MDFSNHVLTTYQYYNTDKIHLGHKGDWGGVIAKCPFQYDYYIGIGLWGDEKFTRDFINEHRIPKHKCILYDNTKNREATSDIFKETAIHSPELNKGLNMQQITIGKSFNLGFIFNSCKNAFVRVDIEGREYEWLNSLSVTQLNNIQQLYIQIYGYNDREDNEYDFYFRLRALERLNETHYLVHACPNNHYSIYEGYMADTFRLNYVRKDAYKEQMGSFTPPLLNITPLPIPGLDHQNNPDATDITFFFPPFCHLSS
jgi:hypothetical protein